MADSTHIEWTDATWNPITGCTLVSEGCRNCYAAQLAATRLKHHRSRKGLAVQNADGVAKFNGKVRFNEDWLDQPLRWKKPRMVFVCAHGDLFHPAVRDSWIDKVLAVAALCPHHTFQVLTKRPELMRSYMALRNKNGHHPAMDYAALMAATGSWNTPALDLRTWPLPNVWLGVSVEDQAAADARIPDLLNTPAAVRFISAEPLLGPVDLSNHRICNECENSPFALFASDPLCPKPTPIHNSNFCPLHWWPTSGCDGVLKSGLDWVIVGGESGSKARPMHPDWARDLRDQCAGADVPFFFKQWGRWLPDCQDADRVWDWADADDRGILHFWDNASGDVTASMPLSKKQAGRLLDGVEHNGMPIKAGEVMPA